MERCRKLERAELLRTGNTDVGLWRETDRETAQKERGKRNR